MKTLEKQLIEKLKELLAILIGRYDLANPNHRKLRDEIAALEKQVEEQESKETKYGKRLDAGRDFLMTQDPKYLTAEDCLEAFGFTRDGLNEII